MPKDIVKKIKEVVKKPSVDEREQNHEIEEEIIKEKTHSSKIPYYTLTPLKLTLLSICTYSIYEIYWFYKNWSIIKEKIDGNFKAYARAIIAPLTAFSFFKNIERDAKRKNIYFPYKPILLWIPYLAFSFLYKLPDPYWMICLFSFVPLLMIQKIMIKLNILEGFDGVTKNKLGISGIVIIIIGGIILILALLGTFLN